MTRHVLITGAGSGFGECLTRRFAAAGWKVTATMRDVAHAPAVFNAMESVKVAQLDITDDANIREAVANATAMSGPIDVLANVAAHALTGTLEETTLEQIRHAFETNVIGTLAVTKAVLPAMRQRRSGHVIAFSSAAGVIAMPTFPTYASTKFAIEGFFESLSYDLAHLGVQVTIIEPGAFATQLGAKNRGPENPISEYAAAGDLLPSMFNFATGNLTAASEAIVSISGRDDAPLRLFVGHGLADVRRRYQQHIDQYRETEHLTKTTVV